MNVRAHVVFRGKVQGVFFRANTQEQALELSVNGWVKNASDGSVEAVFEGEKTRVLDLIEWCSKHQPYARVTKTDVAWEPYTGEFKSFMVRH
jgi:acylphosphatase